MNKQVILITGAAGGLGSALAKRCSAAGMSTILLDRNRAGLEQLSDTIEAEQGITPVLLPLDLEGAGRDDYLAAQAQIDQSFGRLDGLIHCAARFGGLSPHEHIEPKNWLLEIQANVNGPWLLTQTLLPLLRAAENARILFMLDQLQRVDKANWGAYGVSKHALAALVHQLRRELQETSVQVCGINPGPMMTALRAKAYMMHTQDEAPAPDMAAKRVFTILTSVANPAAYIDLEQN